MTVIKASCPCCGQVAVDATDIALMICVADGSLSYYAFKCPQCSDTVKKPAGDTVISLLKSGGVRVRTWTVPAEAREKKTGPPITYDDLLDFGLQLATADVVALAAVPRA